MLIFSGAGWRRVRWSCHQMSLRAGSWAAWKLFGSNRADSSFNEVIMSRTAWQALSGIVFLSWLAIGSSGAVGQENREDTLKKLLERYPAADTNKDGKLSLEEARAYRAKVTGLTPNDADSQKTAKAAKKRKRAGEPELRPDRADLSYGPHPNNKLDLWLAKSDRPTPLIVFIHGGGFVGGDKSSASAAAIKQCLDAGVSFAS